MTNGLSSPKATEAPPGPMPQAARGAPPPSDAFAGMLDAHQARTAIAEGQTESPEQQACPAAVEAAPAEGAPTTADDAGVTPDEATSVAAAVLAAIAIPVTPAAAAPVSEAAAPAEPVAVAAPATQVVVAGGPPTPVVEVVPPAPAEAVAVAPQPVAPAVAATVAEAAPAVAAAVGKPTVVGAPDAPDAPVATAPTATTTTAPAAAAKPATAGQANPETPDQGTQSQPKPEAQAAAAPAPAQQARVAAAYSRPADQPQHVAAPPTAPVAASAPAQPAAPTLPTATPVPLARSAEAVEHVLTLASARGVTHARIALRPAELGSVDVHIRSTAEGLVARVVAHSAETVQTLQHAANDLRRSLEEQGLNVLHLDIGQSGDRSAGRAGSEAGERQQSGGEGPAANDDTPTQTTTLRLPSGVLVDVLA